MNKHLQQLVDLSKIDKEIDAFEPKIEEANHKYETVLATKESISAQIATLEEEIKEEHIKKQKNELHLAELTEKLAENAQKSAEIKTEREMKSLQLEEEIAKEQVNFANEEIARLEKVIETKEELIEAQKSSISEAEEKMQTVKAEVDAVLTEINAERQKVFVRKDELISQMNQKGLSFYQKIRRWAKNTTAVPVKNQACYGCFLTINDKTYAEVIKGEEITTCPHCGRILYIETEEEASA
jgi:predicted  nucleic acid-binding Zn-ribbon protein